MEQNDLIERVYDRLNKQDQQRIVCSVCMKVFDDREEFVKHEHRKKPEEEYRLCDCKGIGHKPTCHLFIGVDEEVQSEVEPFDLTQIPYSAEVRLGKVFKEGEVKYGRGNWKLGADNTQYQLERANHALKHLKVYIHYLETGEYLGEKKQLNRILYEGEDDLAKVAWFCVTQMEIERLEQLDSVKDNK